MFDFHGIARAFSSVLGGQNQSRWAGRRIPLLHAILIVGLGVTVFFALQPTSRSLLFWLSLGATAIGLCEALLALLLPKGPRLALLRLLAGNALVLMGMLTVAEVGFRLSHYDFDQALGPQEDPRSRYPLCFRMPDQPLGDIYFQRQGLISWTGRPLRTFLQMKHGIDQAYETEKPITLSYDRDGFRNPPDLSDWEVAVVGDSFVESGSLPFENLFTTLASQESGLTIRNLGVCNTGTLSHIEYLKRFGKGPSTRHAVLAFYDGNDVGDTEREADQLARFQATGQRSTRELGRQSSLLKAGYQLAKRYVSPPQDRTYQDAWLVTNGARVPITVRPSPMPLDPETMTPKQKLILETSLQQWAAAAKDLGLTPWLLFIPSNNRTYHGLLEFSSRADRQAQHWHPGSLPLHLQALCAKHHIKFISAYEVLRRHAESGQLVYNPILDTHLNSVGSKLIGHLLASELSSAGTPVAKLTRP